MDERWFVFDKTSLDRRNTLKLDFGISNDKKEYVNYNNDILT